MVYTELLSEQNTPIMDQNCKTKVQLWLQSNLNNTESISLLTSEPGEKNLKDKMGR